MPVGIGGIGDIIALLNIVRGFAAALDGSRGSAAEYQEVRRELGGLEAALQCHQQLLHARLDDPALDRIFTTTQTTAEDCQRCIEAFSKQTVSFDRSLGVENGGNVCRDVTKKVRWHMEKKQEVIRFRAELGQHISTLNMLFGLANLHMQQATTENIESKLDALEEKIDSTAETHVNSITTLQARIDKGTKQLGVAVKSAQDESTGRFGVLGSCLFELKGIVSEIFTQSRTTLSGIQQIKQMLLSRSDLSLIRTFTLEDPLGRITQIDLVYVSSFDALDDILEVCFRAFPGHGKVARKEYVFQDEKTNREIQRSTPWSCALLPGQHVHMALLFRKLSSSSQRSYCPYCHLALAQSQEGLIPCACGLSHQRRVETVNIGKEEGMPAFDLYDASSSDSDSSSDVEEASTIKIQSNKSDESRSKAREEMSVFKRVIVVEVEMNVKPGPVPYHDTSSSDWDASEEVSDTEDISTGDIESTKSDESRSKARVSLPIPKATEADARKHRIPPGYSLENWNPSEEPILLLGTVFDSNSLGKWIYDWTVYHLGPATPIADMAGELWLLLIQLSGKTKRAEECMGRIRTAKNREMVDDFIESGDQHTDKLKKLLRSCENPVFKAGKKLGQNAGIEFVDTLFGRDRQLAATEKLMSSVRLWNLRFDTNCEGILRRPGQ